MQRHYAPQAVIRQQKGRESSGLRHSQSMTPPESAAKSLAMTAAEGRRGGSWGERFARAASVFLDALFSDQTYSDCESPQRELALG